MLMHRMTFPLTAQVSLDAAGALTDGPAEMGGEGGHPKYHCMGFWLHPQPVLHSSKRREGKGVERVKMLSPGIYHNLAG